MGEVSIQIGWDVRIPIRVELGALLKFSIILSSSSRSDSSSDKERSTTWRVDISRVLPAHRALIVYDLIGENVQYAKQSRNFIEGVWVCTV